MESPKTPATKPATALGAGAEGTSNPTTPKRVGETGNPLDAQLPAIPAAKSLGNSLSQRIYATSGGAGTTRVGPKPHFNLRPSARRPSALEPLPGLVVGSEVRLLQGSCCSLRWPPAHLRL
jgi:hypothetical protein